MIEVGRYAALAATWKKTWHEIRWATNKERERLETLLNDTRGAMNDYRRALLKQLPIPTSVAHAFTPRETGSHGGDDHIVVEVGFKLGRLDRKAGDALCRRKFWGLETVEGSRLPTHIKCIEMAERIATTKSLDNLEVRY